MTLPIRLITLINIVLSVTLKKYITVILRGVINRSKAMIKKHAVYIPFSFKYHRPISKRMTQSRVVRADKAMVLVRTVEENISSLSLAPLYSLQNLIIPSDNPTFAIATAKSMVVVTKPMIPYCSFVKTRVRIGKVTKENNCDKMLPVKK